MTRHRGSQSAARVHVVIVPGFPTEVQVRGFYAKPTRYGSPVYFRTPEAVAKDLLAHWSFELCKAWILVE